MEPEDRVGARSHRGDEQRHGRRRPGLGAGGAPADLARTTDITNAFDGLTYEKGGGRARHVRALRRPGRVPEGSARLPRGAPASATPPPPDFTRAISDAAGRDVDAAMRTFLDAPGVPLLEVQSLCDGVPRPAREAVALRAQRVVGDERSAVEGALLCSLRPAVTARRTSPCLLVESAEVDVPLEGGKLPGVGDAERERSRLLPHGARADGSGEAARRGVRAARFARATGLRDGACAPENRAARWSTRTW